MRVAVICLNDYPDFVTTEDKAEGILAQRKHEYWIKNKYSFRDIREYINRCYWHIEIVESDINE